MNLSLRSLSKPMANISMSTIAATVLLVFVGTFATPQNVPSTAGLPVFIAVLLLLVTYNSQFLVL